MIIKLKNIFKVICFFNLFFIFPCYAKTIEIDTKDIKELSVSCIAKEVGSQLIFEETTDSKLKIDYNDEFYSVDSKAENDKLNLDIAHLKMAVSYPFDYVTIYLPTDKYDKISTYVKTSSLVFKDIKDIDCNFEITANASSVDFKLPKDFNKDIELKAFNGSNCSLDFIKFDNFKLDLKSDVESYITLPREWNYNQTKEFKYGKGESTVKLDIEDAYFKFFLNRGEKYD